MSSENYIIHDQHAVHFLTFTVIDWIDIFTRASYKIEIANALEYCQKNKGLRLFAYCLMTNHLHMVCQTDEPYKLSEFVRDFKKHTAKTILKKIRNDPESRRSWILVALREAGKYDNRITYYKFWQEGCHPIPLMARVCNSLPNYLSLKHEQKVQIQKPRWSLLRNFWYCILD